VILSGDFHQLPPVAKYDGPPYIFAFEAGAWSSVIPNSQVVILEKVFRQSDETFIRILEGLRSGYISKGDEKVLKGLSRTLKYDDGIDPIVL
jgi:ATP-dependent DNA helicase PIF1